MDRLLDLRTERADRMETARMEGDGRRERFYGESLARIEERLREG